MALRRVMPPVKPSGSASSNRLIETNDTLNAPMRIKGSAEAHGAYRIYSYVHTERGFSLEVLPSRVFMNGNSQAVRIPAEFRLSSDRVQISRTPEGDLLVHPCPSQRGQALMQALSGFDADFVDALEQQQADKPLVQEREEL